LALEIRADDADVRDALKFLDDPAARAETQCERALLEKLGGGCQVPIGAHANFHGGKLDLRAVVASPDGHAVVRESKSGSDPQALGAAVADALLQQGGAAILDAVYGKQVAVPQQP
jgi:hydroxymethylbilane synthase